MINPNELRIGDFVIDRYNDCICIDEYWMEVFMAIRDYESLQPIPLTPEILEKCGFDKQEHGSGNFKAVSQCKQIESSYERTSIDHWNGKTFLTDIDGGTVGEELKSLHQLQNLYFALTGEELKVNL